MMDLDRFIALAKAYQGLGWAVQEQLDAVLNGEDPSAQNPHAMSLAGDFLRRAVLDDVESADDALALVEEVAA